MRRLDQIDTAEVEQWELINTALDTFNVPGERYDQLLYLLSREMLFDAVAKDNKWEPHQIANRYYELLAKMLANRSN